MAHRRLPCRQAGKAHIPVNMCPECGREFVSTANTHRHEARCGHGRSRKPGSGVVCADCNFVVGTLLDEVRKHRRTAWHRANAVACAARPATPSQQPDLPPPQRPAPSVQQPVEHSPVVAAAVVGGAWDGVPRAPIAPPRAAAELLEAARRLAPVPVARARSVFSSALSRPLFKEYAPNERTKRLWLELDSSSNGRTSTV